MECPQQKGHQRRNDSYGEPLAVAEAGVLHRAILQSADAKVITLDGPTGRSGAPLGAFPLRRPSGIPILIMSTHKIAFTARDYSLPRSGSKPSLDDKLDKVFQMAEHMDAKCVYMLDHATHKRRSGLSVR